MFDDTSLLANLTLAVLVEKIVLVEDSYSRDLAAGNIDPKSGKKVSTFPLLAEVNKIIRL